MKLISVEVVELMKNMSSICGNFPYFLKMTVCLISLSSSSACPLVFFQISIAHILLLEFVFCAMCSVGF